LRDHSKEEEANKTVKNSSIFRSPVDFDCKEVGPLAPSKKMNAVKRG